MKQRSADIEFQAVAPWADRQPLRTGALLVSLALLAFGITAASILVMRHVGRIAAIWPLNAIFLTLCLRTARPRWRAFLTCMVVGDGGAILVTGGGPFHAALFALTTTSEVLIAALLLTRHGRPRLIRRADLSRLMVAVSTASAVSTLIAAVGVGLTGTHIHVDDAVMWFMSDTLGLLLLAPMAGLLLARPVRSIGQGGFGALLPELGLLIAVACGVFLQSRFPLLFVVVPAMVLIAHRHGPRGAAVGTLALTAIATPLTLCGMGPTVLVPGDLQTRILVLQVFLAATFLSTLVIASTAAQRATLLRRLQRSRERMTLKSDRQRMLLQMARLAEQLSGVGYWTLDPVAGKVTWSTVVYEIHGVDAADYDLNYHDAVAFYVPEDRDRVADLIQQSMASKVGYSFEARLTRRRDGAVRKVRSSAQCQLDDDGNVRLMFGVFKDITEDAALLAEVQRQEELYRLLAENSTDVIATYSPDGVYTYLSPSAEDLLGYTVAELIGRGMYDVIHPDDHAAVASAFTTGLEARTHACVEYRAIRKDGAVIWLEAKPKFRFHPDGSVINIVDSVRDVTERHGREAVLQQARREAESAVRAKADFLSNMSHEIRTPLNGVLGFADLLAKTTLDSDQQRYVDRINSAGGSLLSVINDILDFSKIEAGKMEVEQQPYSIRRVIDDVIWLVSAAHKGGRLKMTQSIAADVPNLCVGDESRVRQVLINIVSNAAKFTGEGAVEVSAHMTADRLVVCVDDTGPGISPSKLAHVFDSFSQADTTVTRRYGGTGLGLSISRSLARLMGGDLRLESEFGHGTRAIFEAPIGAGHSFVEPAPRSPEAQEMVTSVSARVMVVDDLEINCELVRTALNLVGHEVRTFQSAQAALMALEAGETFDLILMDVQMPVMDGLTATRLVRAMAGPVAHIPIVALTASAMPAQAAECRAAGMNAHLAKPIDFEKLYTIVDEYTSTRSGDPAQSPPAPPVEPQALTAMRAQYQARMASLAAELEGMLDLDPPSARAPAVAALAHSIAGTSGTFGFRTVSESAFQLEAAARHVEAGATSSETLRDAVAAFVPILAEPLAA